MAHIRKDPRSGNYHVLYRDANKRQRTKGGFKSKKQAQVWATQTEAKIQRGEFVDPQRGKVRFEDFVAKWLIDQHHLKAKTHHGYEQIVRARLVPALGHLPLAKIDHACVQGFINTQAERYAPNSVKKTYAVLRRIFESAVHQDLIIKNPALTVRLPRASTRKMLFLTAAQVEALANAVPEHYGTLVRFAAWTGLRAGELAALRVGNFTDDLAAVRVMRSVADVGGRLIEDTTKTDRSRTVGVPASLREDVRAHLARVHPAGFGPDDLLFPGEKGGWHRHQNFYRRYFRPAVQRRYCTECQATTAVAAECCVECEGELAYVLPEALHGLRFHDLRHTAAALMISLGAHPKEIAERLGHSSITVTMDRYGHVFPSRDAALTAALDEALRASRATT